MFTRRQSVIATLEFRFLNHLGTDIDLKYDRPVIVGEDNTGAITIANKPAHFMGELSTWTLNFMKFVILSRKMILLFFTHSHIHRCSPREDQMHNFLLFDAMAKHCF